MINITGKNIKMLRKQSKLTQKELADMLGYGYTAVSNYESGRNEPSIKDLIKISDIFGITLDELIGHRNLCNTEIKLFDVLNNNYIIKNSLEIKIKEIEELIDNL